MKVLNEAYAPLFGEIQLNIYNAGIWRISKAKSDILVNGIFEIPLIKHRTLGILETVGM